MSRASWKRAIANAAAVAFGALAIAGTAPTPASAQLFGHRGGALVFPPVDCQTDYEIRRKFTSLGYTDIKLNAPLNSQIQVRAAKGGRIYLIDYNYCRGSIDDITPLKAAAPSRRSSR